MSKVMLSRRQAEYLPDIIWRLCLTEKICLNPIQKLVSVHYLYISNSANTKFQPMNANFGIIDGLKERIRNKAERYNKIANRALDIMKDKLKGENDDE